MMFSKSITNRFFAMTIAVLALTSCLQEESISNKEREQISLEAWIRLNKPELLNNYQVNGGYYVEILDGDKNEQISANGNDFGSEPLMEQDTCWFYANMTGRNINGTICMTRSGQLAEMCGTFSYFTHYVPFVNYCGSINNGLMEGTYLATRNEFKIGNSVYRMRRGSKVRLYLPSSIAYGETGSSSEGGYEGQYALDPSRPLVFDIEVLRAIKNPSDKELAMVKSFVGYDTKWKQALKPEEERTSEEDDMTLTGLHYSLDFNPSSSNIHERYLQPHLDGLNNRYIDTKKYADMDFINDSINKILLKRFGEGLGTDKQNESTQVAKGGRANIWYIVRFFDGFVIDTNIAEIRSLVFDEKSPICEVFSYSPADDEGKEASERMAIGAWYYCIPQMHYGSYGQIVTTSGYAYGATGMTGSTTTETTSSGDASYYNAMNYYNYYNSYYDYYGSYYDYYNYNYYNYNTSDSEEETTTTTTISTEILPYTPLVFTLFVEPN